MIADIIAELSGVSDKFKLDAIQAHALTVYVQPSQLVLYLRGDIDTLTITRTPDTYVFTKTVEILP